MVDKTPTVTQEPAMYVQTFTSSETATFQSAPIPLAKPSQTLEQWAQAITSTTDSEGSPTVNLSRFGLKNANDVMQFLKSPAGESIVAEIGAEIALKDAIQQQQQFEQQQQQALMSRVQALMFLWYLDEKSDAEAQIRDIIISDNQKAIERGASKTGEQLNPHDQHSVYSTINTYDQAIKVAYQKHEQLSNEELALADEEDQVIAQGEELNEKYAHYQHTLETFALSMQDGEEHDEHIIARQLQTVTQELDKQVDKINQIIEIDDEATQLLEHQHALHMVAGTLHDMLAVNKGDKYYANAEGEPVKSFKEADFVLNKVQKIVKDNNGKHYLLNKNQDWNTVKDNPELLKQAEKSYDHSKQDMMSVRKVIDHNKNLEFVMHNERMQYVQNKVSANRTQQLDLENQIGVLQSARANLLTQAPANATNLTKMPDAVGNMPTPTPTVSAASSPAPRPRTNPTTTFFRERLQALKDTDNISRHDLRALANQAPAENRQAARLYIQNELANIPRRAPIPYQTMQTMLKNLERFGVDTTKPGLASDAQPTAPSPFKTDL